jgi:L-fuconolactonase
MKIDSHQHFWKYDVAQYPWIPQGSPLHRDWLPPDLAPLLAQAGLDGCIAVQARQSLEESRWLLELAGQNPVIKGVVGWVDLRAEDVEADLVALAAHPKLRGVRHVVQDEPDPDFMLGADFLRGIGKLHALGLTYDFLIFQQQLPAAIEVARRFPEQAFVLDHIAKPAIKSGTLSPWREHLRELATFPNVSCKISGLVTEADHAHWQPADFAPYLDIVVSAFGEDRIMYGSDWPVCLLAGSYERVHELANHATRDLGATAQEKFFGDNAARFYGIR